MMFHNSIDPVYIKIAWTCDSVKEQTVPILAISSVFFLAPKNTAQIMNETRAAEPDSHQEILQGLSHPYKLRGCF